MPEPAKKPVDPIKRLEAAARVYKAQKATIEKQAEVIQSLRARIVELEATIAGSDAVIRRQYKAAALAGMSGLWAGDLNNAHKIEVTADKIAEVFVRGDALRKTGEHPNQVSGKPDNTGKP